MKGANDLNSFTLDQHTVHCYAMSFGYGALQVELDAMHGADELEVLAKLEGEEAEEQEGATMMGRKARQLMMSGQGDAALQAFKVHLHLHGIKLFFYNYQII